MGPFLIWRETVLSLLDALEISKAAHIVGHSLGGAISLLLALHNAERVLLTVSLICPGGLGADINLDFIDGFIAADRRKDMKLVLGHLFATPEAVQRKMVEESLRYKRLDGVSGSFAGDPRRKFQQRPNRPPACVISWASLTVPRCR